MIMEFQAISKSQGLCMMDGESSGPNLKVKKLFEKKERKGLKLGFGKKLDSRIYGEFLS